MTQLKDIQMAPIEFKEEEMCTLCHANCFISTMWYYRGILMCRDCYTFVMDSNGEGVKFYEGYQRYDVMTGREKIRHSGL